MQKRQDKRQRLPDLLKKLDLLQRKKLVDWLKKKNSDDWKRRGPLKRLLKMLVKQFLNC